MLAMAVSAAEAWAGAVAAASSFGCLALMFIPSAQRKRKKAEWEHAERMKRLELGLPVSQAEAPAAMAMVCIAVGAGVPAVAFVTTLIAYLNKYGVADEIWLAPTVVSVVSVVTSGSLAVRLFAPAPASDADRVTSRKLVQDPDALDVVSSRG